MSEGHSTVGSSVTTCSASTSGEIPERNDAEATRNKAEQPYSKNRPSRFCVNEIPWKLVPQTFGDEGVYEYLDENEKRVSDVESFVWKWSPCGRYGVDLPGGRDMINQQLKNQMAVFDLHTNSWTLYSIDVPPSEIPRVCFLYWARNDIIVVVTLVKDYEPGPDEEVRMKFKQSFYYVSHESKTLEHAGSCKYRTNKTIVASYWFHIFENRRGEPFVDHNNDLWLVFSNGKDALILLPYIPTPSCYKSKCVTFNMDEIVSGLLGTRVFLDPFISSHFVPWVYQNDINFFIRIDSYSFVEEEDRDYGEDPEVENLTTKENRGFFQIRVNLKDVIEKGEKTAGENEKDASRIETRFTRSDVELWRKIADDSRHEHQCITQHNKHIVLLKWTHFSIDMTVSKRLGTRIADVVSRDGCCSARIPDFAFCSIDLDTEKIRKFDTMILGTDVILPHPSGSMFMFRYKEEFAMTFCELPYFEPLSLRLKCMQSLSGCVEIDPAYYTKMCILKRVKDENPEEQLSQ